MMAKFVVTEFARYSLATAICEKAGIDPDYVRRLVIDLRVGHAGLIYVELMGDDSILDVDIHELGVEITESPSQNGAKSDA